MDTAIELFKRLGCPEDASRYNELYGALNVKDKIVVDIGADFGSTAYFFKQQGAKEVLCLEINQEYINIFNTIVSKELDVTGIRYVDPSVFPLGDILKIDCEGCEVALTEDYINKFEQFNIGIHPWIPQHQFIALTNMVIKCGGKLQLMENYNAQARIHEYVWQKL